MLADEFSYLRKARRRAVPPVTLVWMVALFTMLIPAVSLQGADGVDSYRSGPALDEANLSATQVLHVRLTSQPSAGQVVVIDLGSDTVNGVTLSQNQLTFTNANWSVFQDTTITTVDDTILEAASHIATVTLTINQPATTFSAYDSVIIADQQMVIKDNEGPMTVYRIGQALDEANTAATQMLRVRLNTQPTAGQVVVIDLGSDTVNGVTLSQNQLTFTDANWSVFQDTTITTVDDTVLEAASHIATVTLTINQPATTFSAYDSMIIADQQMVIKDNEGLVTVYRIGQSLDEANTAATQMLRVRLNTQPTAGQVVVIDLGSDTVNGVTLSQNQLTFTDANWNVFQDTTITTVDDAAAEAALHITAITLTIDQPATTFSAYDSVTIADQQMVIKDNEGPVTVYRIGQALDEANTAVTQALHVRLNTQPTAGQVVVIDLGSDTVNGVTLSQNQLTFTNANWNVFQDTTITAVDDTAAEAALQITAITLTIDQPATTFSAYDSVTIADQQMVIRDNEGPVTVYRIGKALDEANTAATQTLYVRLNTQPTAGQVVVIDLGSDTVNGVTLSQSQLTFTNANWNVFQDTTITTVDDAAIEGADPVTSITLTVNAAATTFDAFDAIVIPDQNAKIADNDHNLSLSETALSFNATQAGGNPADQNFNITRTGNGTAAWTINSSAAWLTTSPTSGSTTDETDIITVSINKALASVGVNTATLTVTDPVAGNNPRTIDVTFTVTTSPTQFVLSSTSIAYDSAKDLTPTLTVDNGGTGTLNWTAVSNQSWLAPSVAAGATVYNSPATVNCKLYFTLLAPGTYNATLTLTSAEANNSPQVVNVAMTVKAINDFETSGSYLRTLHVNPAGNDGTADGSIGLPYRTLSAAVNAAVPGDILQLAAGNFESWPDNGARTLMGTYANPIKIQGDPSGGTTLLCSSGGTGSFAMNFTSSAFLTIQDLNVTEFSDRGINLTGDAPIAGHSHHIVIRRCSFFNSTNTAPSAIRMTNTECSLIEDCTITTPVAHASNDPIRIVSSHHNIVRDCYVHDCLRNAVRLANLCEDNLFFGNKIENTVNNGLYLNGFRNSAVANLLINTDVPLRFEDAEEPLAANNTIYLPQQYCLWFSTPGGNPFIVRNGRVINNIFVFNTGDITNFALNGASTFPSSYQYKNNAWYSLDNDAFAGPTNTAAAEIAALYQVDPQFLNVAGGNYRLKAGSGLRGNGLALTEVPNDADGNAYASPPARGAYEQSLQATIQLSTNSLFFTLPSGGGSSVPESVDVTNTGIIDAALTWTASSPEPWLQVTPAAGATTTTETDAISIQASTIVPESWTSAATVNNAPSARETASVVWTGAEMILFGGWDANGVIAGGARFDPDTNSWTTIATTGAPSARNSHTAVWTGAEMIVWGGWDGTTWLNGGARYNPSTDTWTSKTETTDAPVARRFHSAVWTGTEMIIWGGAGNSSALQDGGRYNPVTNSWSQTAISATDAPSARLEHSAVWTGSEMIVWGGCTTYAELSGLQDGGRYDPATNRWDSTAMSATNAPTARFGHAAVWTGSKMIVWGGGVDPFNQVATGAWYDESTNTWTGATPTVNAPQYRQHTHAVWTGSRMLVWGGYTHTTIHVWQNDTHYLNPGFTLAPGSYAGTVYVSDPSASNNPQIIDVTLTVDP